MISKTELNSLIRKTDESIQKYSRKFLLEKNKFDFQTGNNSFLCNERTIAAATTVFICSSLKDIGYKISLVVNEFPIELKKELNVTEFDIVRGMTSLKTRTSQWKRCFVDGYLQIEKLLSFDEPTQIFIEYKMQNKFIDLDLATDYLKYKTYTFNNNDNTVFVYVVFKKEENYPGIMADNEPFYELLQEDISNKHLDGSKRVFIFMPDSSEANKQAKNNPSDALTKMMYFSELTEKVSSVVSGNEEKISNDDMVYVKAMKKFNSNVLKSYKLRHYYPFIKKVWDSANEKSLFENLDEIFGLSNEEITIKKIIEEGTYYHTNLTSIITVDTKIEAAKKGTTSSTNTSLFLVSLCDYFNERFHCGIQEPDYYSKSFKSGKNKKRHNWQETVNYFKSELDKNFTGYDDADRRIKKLFYSTIFYIVHLFPIIYVIDDSDAIVDYSERYSSFKILEIFQQEIDKILKYFNFKGSIDVIDLLNGYSNNKENSLTAFVKEIINKY